MTTLWRERCTRSGAPFPPGRIALLAFKAERTLEVWAGGVAGPMARLHTYAILAASGGAGPKLREGDGQVPEGVYRVVVLNPLSRYHLSMGLDYPNAFDRDRGVADGREALGSEIYIHGGEKSTGCLAIGDGAIEELFWLAALAGIERMQVVIAPNDGRDGGEMERPADGPVWIGALHEKIRAAWGALPPIGPDLCFRDGQDE